MYIVPPTTPPPPHSLSGGPMIPPSFFYGALEFGEGEAWGREYGLAVELEFNVKVYTLPAK